MFVHDSERVFAETVNQISHANPFDRQALERLQQEALRIELPEEVRDLRLPAPSMPEFPELAAVAQRAECAAEVSRRRLAAGRRSNERDSILYRDLVQFVLYFRYRLDLQGSIAEALQQSEGDMPDGRASRARGVRIPYYDRFARDAEKFLGPTTWLSNPSFAVEHRFAILFQYRRAFHFIHAKIQGRARAMERLRATVWQSVFTHDMARYDQFLYDRMHDTTTLITGPSGTGKDLVAEAIGQSRYIRFDVRKKAFADTVAGAFHPVNLSAFPSELIEAELFGNRQGAYTGALDRTGLLELCGPLHSVFLDEIGELSQAIQVKLLRVLQNRTFQRIGDTRPQRFDGKVIAATNRDLDEEMRLGRFRRDFYFRLCSDRICTPSLAEQLADNADELPYLVGMIARRLYGDAAESLTTEVVEWIDKHLPKNYAWPGNMRELEQCIRNVLVRKEYHPPREHVAAAHDEFTDRLTRLQLAADQLLSWYCRAVFAETRSYAETARRLDLDRRTVRRRVDNDGLDRLD